MREPKTIKYLSTTHITVNGSHHTFLQTHSYEIEYDTVVPMDVLKIEFILSK